MSYFGEKSLILIAVLAGVAACGSGSEPRLTGPASLALDTAAATAATVGTTVTPAPVFVVRDSGGRPIPNVSVNFFATLGGSVVPATVVTDAKGRARPNSWVLGPVAGVASLIAQLSANSALQASSSTTAQPGPAAHIVPSASSLTLGLTDTIPLSVNVTDAYHNAIGTVAVTYSSSDPTVASVAGNKVIAHSAGNATITATVTGTTVSTTIPATVITRFGHLAGRPFGIAFAHGQQDLLLVTSQDVHSLISVSASTYAVGASAPVGANPPDVVVNAQATLAYVTSVDGSQVTIVNLPAMTVAQTIADMTTTRVLLSPDGTLLYVAKQGGVDVFSTATRVKVGSVGMQGVVNGIALSSDGSVLWASTNLSSGQLFRVTTSNMVITDSVTIGGTPQEVVYHAASGNVYVANEAGWVDVYKGADLTPVTRFSSLAGAFGMCLSGDGSTLYVGSTYGGNVYVVSRVTGVVSRTVNVGGLPRRMALLPDGRVAVANEGAYVSLIQ